MSPFRLASVYLPLYTLRFPLPQGDAFHLSYGPIFNRYSSPPFHRPSSGIYTRVYTCICIHIYMGLQSRLPPSFYNDTCAGERFQNLERNLVSVKSFDASRFPSPRIKSI